MSLLGGMASSAGGLWTPLRTLFGSKGNSSVLAHPDLMFRSVNADLRARLYSDVKRCLPAVFAPSRYNRSTCSQYAVSMGQILPRHTAEACAKCGTEGGRG